MKSKSKWKASGSFDGGSVFTGSGFENRQKRNGGMNMRFRSTVMNSIMLLTVIFMLVGFEAIGEESILFRQHDLSKERSLEPQCYQMDVEIITRAGNGSSANIETYSMCMRGKLVKGSAGKISRWTCDWFALKIGKGSKITVPALKGWSYDFNKGVGVDENGQVLGIPHAKFENLTDNNGKKLDPVVGYQVYNQFVQFHAYVDQFAAPDPEGGTGIQELKRIGDRLIYDDFTEDLPLAVGLIIKKGSVYTPGIETLELKGLSVVNSKSCFLLGIDGGEGSFTMIIEAMPDVNAKTVGGTRVFGDLYVDFASMWLQKAEITVVDVTETSIGDTVVANTTIESHYRINAITK